MPCRTSCLKETELGRKLAESVGEMEAAAKELQAVGEGLTREKLLDIVIAAPNEARIRAYVNLARGGMDYSFFQTLTDKIEKAAGDEKTKLEGVREKLLEYTNEVDRQLEARYKQAQQLIDELLKAEDIGKATQDNLQKFSQDAVDIVQQKLRQASEKNDYAMMGKLQKMVEVLQAASAPPPEVAFIEQLLEAPDEAAIEKMLDENSDAGQRPVHGGAERAGHPGRPAGREQSRGKSPRRKTGRGLQDRPQVLDEKEFGIKRWSAEILSRSTFFTASLRTNPSPPSALRSPG